MPDQSAREISLRKYFATVPSKPTQTKAITLIAIGGVFLLLGFAASGDSSGCGTALMFPAVALGLIGGGIFWSQNSSYRRELDKVLPQPTDMDVDRWFRESLANLVERSKRALGLDEDECSFREPLTIAGPVLWETYGINSEDIASKTGNDRVARFGVYRVTIIYLTERHLAAYACNFNFIKDVPLSEQTDEYHYQDVVAVSTREQATSYTLPTGEKLTHAQEFSLSASSGEKISVIVGADAIRKMTGADRLFETGADKAVATIRAMLKDKKLATR